jgi:hypothetical protein
MRWIFLTLSLLNVFIFGMSWLEKNDHFTGKSKDFIPIENVKAINTVGSKNDDKEGVGVKVKFKPLCLLLGPIITEKEAEIIENRLNSKGIKSRKIVQEIAKAPNYWVYLKPFSTKSEAILKLKRLQSANIDSYLISQGVLANGISLGVFENIDSAKDMLKTRIKQGYPAEIRNLPKSTSRFWVGVNEQYNIELVNRISDLLKNIKMPPEKRQIFCESIASELNLP